MRIFSFLFFLLFTVSAFSQVESPYIQNFTNKVYGKNSNPEIYAVVQDNNNSIIAGTSNGVLVYNGNYWKFVGVKQGAHVISLNKTKSGKIMLGSVGDFGELVKNDKGIYHYTSYCKKEKITSTVWRVHTVGEDSYFQTDSDIFVFNKGEKKAKIKAETSFHLSFEIDGKVYVRQRNKGLYVINGTSLQIVDESFKMKTEGLFTLFQQKKQLRYFFRDDFSTNPLESSIYGGITLRDGNYALNTLSDGVYILDPTFKVKFHYNQATGLSDNDVKQIYQGSDGNLWAATNNGLSYIEYQSDLSFYNDKHGLNGDVNDVILFSANKQTYFASSKGVFLKTETGIEKLGINSPAWEFIEQNKRLFVATSLGVFEIKGKESTLKKAGVCNNIGYFQNQFVLSGPSGIEFCDGNFKTTKLYEVPINRSLKIQLDKKRNELWIGTIGSGLYRIKSDLSLEVYDDVFDGLNISWIKPIFHNNKLVFATKDGLQSFVYEEEIMKSLPDSLKNNSDFNRGIFEPVGPKDEISETTRFRNQNLVVILNEIKRQSGVSFFNTAYSFLDFGRINSIKNLSDGNLYICTSEGVTVIEKNATVYQSDFKLSIDYIRSKTKSLRLNLSEAISFSENDLKFNLNAPLFFHSSKVRFRYKMTDEQDDWSSLSLNRSLSFPKLFEGTYTIYIQAENSFGEKSNVLKYTFTISPPWYRTIYAYLFYLIVLIFSFWFAIKISKRRLQRKNEELEEIVKERTHEIELQKEEIEEKHKEITDSINYAERIQTALMMSDEHWEGFAKDYFILFKPRDVVSGDFYWAYQNDDFAIWTAADCTGHGVPGAFMSMLGIGFLNEIVIEGKNTEPAEILNLLRSKIIKALMQKGSAEERKDGMDISLCCWDKKANTVKFAGANNPLILITENEEKANSFGDDKLLNHNGKFLVTVPADKMPVGKFINDEKSFSQKEFILDKNDLFFSFSDGFQDQFGGQDGKKYMIKRLKTFLLMQDLAKVSDFKSLLENEFNVWIKEGNTEQVDDVCIVGIQL